MPTSCELGFDYFARLHHASLAVGRAGLIRIDNYPADWVAELTADHLAADDPVARGGYCGLLQF